MTLSATALSVWDEAARKADHTVELGGGVPMFFRRIPAGEFRMGSRGFYGDEEPAHRVLLTHDFYLGTFAVTQSSIGPSRATAALQDRPEPSHFKGARRPVEQVSWREAMTFCDWLTRTKAGQRCARRRRGTWSSSG